MPQVDRVVQSAEVGEYLREEDGLSLHDLFANEEAKAIKAGCAGGSGLIPRGEYSVSPASAAKIRREAALT